MLTLITIVESLESGYKQYDHLCNKEWILKIFLGFILSHLQTLFEDNKTLTLIFNMPDKYDLSFELVNYLLNLINDLLIELFNLTLILGL
jgi:hypothetical protein